MEWIAARPRPEDEGLSGAYLPPLGGTAGQVRVHAARVDRRDAQRLRRAVRRRRGQVREQSLRRAPSRPLRIALPVVRGAGRMRTDTNRQMYTFCMGHAADNAVPRPAGRFWRLCNVCMCPVVPCARICVSGGLRGFESFANVSVTRSCCVAKSFATSVSVVLSCAI